MIKVRKIELLAPAKNLECGIEAINHGADAVYIGAPKFGARSAVGNSLEDIHILTQHAHQFGARVYVALNTILNDSELIETEKLIWDLHKIEVDAIIIQDMGILMLNLPPIPLHASTQGDNRSLEKVQFMANTGFSQVVLARELSMDEIKNIADNVTVTLEAFVHGALCVCYSGQCYLSEAISKRSANKGACAQFCRLPYTLIDSEGESILQQKHLLSMKDLNLSEQLENMIDAGISSLKIEGRLKDIQYVKNVVAYYRLKIDEILSRRQEYIKASAGTCKYTFKPDLDKSFNRGYTQYFFNGRTPDMWTLNTPKSVGEPIGKVKDVFDRFFTLSGTKKVNNGDGLCFMSHDNKELLGLRINRIDGEKIFPAETHFQIRKGTFVYRNYDHEFDKVLSKKSAERKIDSIITLNETTDGFSINAEDESGITSLYKIILSKELAQKDQTENITNNLSKSGNTIFKISQVKINTTNNWFIPSSLLSEWRRIVLSDLLINRISSHIIETVEHKPTCHAFPIKEITYLGNVMNEKSKTFYNLHQANVSQMAFEKESLNNVPLMFTRHCIKQSMGWCPKESKIHMQYKEPLYLIYNTTHLKLEFDCKKCEMRVYNN